MESVLRRYISGPQTGDTTPKNEEQKNSKGKKSISVHVTTERD